jgi:hypothetical protein
MNEAVVDDCLQGPPLGNPSLNAKETHLTKFQQHTRNRERREGRGENPNCPSRRDNNDLIGKEQLVGLEKRVANGPQRFEGREELRAQPAVRPRRFPP